MPGTRLELLQQVLQACGREYSDIVQGLSQLDSKASSNISIAGVLIAAGLVFVQSDTAMHALLALGRTAIPLLAACIVVLLASVVVCLSAISTQWVLGPPASVELKKLVDDLESLPPEELNGEVQENFVRDQVRLWREALGEHHRLYNRRARRLQYGHWLLTAAVFLVAAVIFMVLWSLGLTPHPEGGR